MPEERFDYDNKEMNRHRAWFPVRPEGFDQMIQRQESLLVTLQSRPPGEDLDLTAGRYLWNELRPDGAWLGRRLLTPRTLDQPIRFETLPILLQPVVPNKNIRHRFDDGVASSMLVWKRKVTTPFPVSLSVDGTPFFKATLAGATGFMELPTIRKGIHQLNLQAPATGDYYINGAAPSPLISDHELYLFSLANRLGEKGLSFTLERTTMIPETLWGRFYRLGEASRSQLSVRIEGLPKSITVPVQQWSFDHLRLDLRSDNPGTTLVLGSTGERVNGGQPFFIQFGDGTPPGRYRIHVQTEAGVSGYLILAQVISGVVEQRRMFMEETNSTRWKESLLLGISLMGTTQAMAGPKLANEFLALSESLQSVRQNRRFQLPDTKELLMAKSLFERILAGEKGTTMAQAWQNLGFEWVDWHGLHLLKESPTRNEGRGFFLFRPEPADEMLIQIPHGETDERTGELGIRLALEGKARVVAWNTVPRTFSGVGSGPINADLAHLEQTLFIALTEAFVGRLPQGTVVQMHGFSQEKRRSTAGKQADLIVSAGHPAPGLRHERLVACMRRNGVVATKLYGREVKELGGETNSINKRMRALGMTGFLHLEMSRPLRDRLAMDGTWRAAFYHCLAHKE